MDGGRGGTIICHWFDVTVVTATQTIGWYISPRVLFKKEKGIIQGWPVVGSCIAQLNMASSRKIKLLVGGPAMDGPALDKVISRV